MLTSAQLWNILFEDELDPAYFLNEETIKKNNIYQIEGSISNKKKNDKIRATQLIRQYTFNADGKITKIIETIPNGFQQDTITICLTYNEKQLLTSKIRTDKFGSSAKVFHYDENDRLQRKEWKRLQAQATCNYKELDLVDFVTFTYKFFPSQIKQTAYNSEDRPFEEIILYKDDNGQIIQQSTKNLRTSATNHIYIQYDEQGRIMQLEQNNSYSKNTTKKFVITYDNADNVSAIFETINNVPTREFQFLYQDETGLLSYLLIQDEATEFIQIFKVEEMQQHRTR
jgi:hypothetical protein